MTDTQSALAEVLRFRREALGLTQDDVAKAVDMSRASIANIERAEQVVTVPLLVKLANALATTPAELVSGLPAHALPEPWAVAFTAGQRDVLRRIREFVGDALAQIPAEAQHNQTGGAA